MTYTHPLADAADVSLVGGKAANLGKLIRAGFSVPGGFVINIHAVAAECQMCVNDQILAAYAAMGGGTVAVRSSATAEDAAAASMAGQYETFLNIDGPAAVIEAAAKCHASLKLPRVSAYLAEHGIDEAGVGMAVIVQRQVAADVAGVLFTAAPDDAYPRQMLIDAAWGLGESVVSGRVQPDVLRVSFDDGDVISAIIAVKKTELTLAGEADVPEDRQNVPCLSSHDVHRLWQLGRQAEAHFGCPQDIEWAIAGGDLMLLQSRPITTHADAALRASLIERARTQLKTDIAAGQGPWVLHNLSETLPRPTPLTWSVIQRFMSGDGAYGQAYRAAGFSPDPKLATSGFLDLIGGQIYMDAARAPRMFAADFPLEYDADVLRRSPDASQLPPTRTTGSMLARLRAGRMLQRANRTLVELAKDLDAKLRSGSFVELQAYISGWHGLVSQAVSSDPQDTAWDTKPCHPQADRLSLLTPTDLIELWRAHERRVMDEFGTDEILAGLAAGLALDELQSCVQAYAWDEDAGALARLLSSGGEADATMIADAGLYEVGHGRRTIEDWLTHHGHRGVGELDLASPRWRERPDAVRIAAERMAASESPADRHHRHGEAVAKRLADLVRSLTPVDRGELLSRVGFAQQMVRLREDAKDVLMRGYDLLRDVALECGRRLSVGSDVFYLSREEMLAGVACGYASIERIERRKKRTQAERRIELPSFIGAGEVAVLGERASDAGDSIAKQGGAALAVSAGVATGVVLVVHSPEETINVEPGYVLVCPSTDPSWTPLFAEAAALVIECGGVLSHGAVVAREMGLPAVVLPGATKRFKTGDRVNVDGWRGYVGLVSDEAANTAGPDEFDTRLSPGLLPPPARAKGKRAARGRNFAAAAWGLFLLAIFTLPDRVLRLPVFTAWDSVLWPFVRACGWPAAVTIIAVVMATVTLLMQRYLTDNRRLLEAKKRAAVLRREAMNWPAGSPRRLAMSAAAGGVPGRLLGASLLPVALLLGPMVVMFLWLGERATPANWAPAAGTPFAVVATIDGEWTQPVTLYALPDVRIDKATPATQSLPPLRKTLEELLTFYRQPKPTTPGEPWQLSVAPDPGRKQSADDLQRYLDGRLPPQGLSWQLRPLKGIDGTFHLLASTPGHTPMSMAVTLGDRQPPQPTTVAGERGSPIQSLRVVYPIAATGRVFWRVAGFEVGWLSVYVAAYVVTLMTVRWVARIA